MANLLADTDVNGTLVQLVEVNPIIQNSIKILKEMAEDIKNLHDDDSLIAEEVERLREQCRKLITLKLKANKVHDALEYSKRQAFISNDDTLDLESVFNTKQNEEMAVFQNETELTKLIKLDIDYRSFESHLFGIGLVKRKTFQSGPAGEGDNEAASEVVVAGQNIVFKDPFSQREIEDGVRNRHCGHLYERGTVAEMLKQHQRNRRKLLCPYVGCSNKVAIKEDDLEDVE